MEINEIQADLLKEAFNLGVGRAAQALSEIAGGEEIELSVPQVQIKSVESLISQIRKLSGDQIAGVSESFRGPFNGRAMMLYSQQESLELVKIMLGDHIPVEALSEMEGEALCEVGNIVLNACISTLANLLETEIETEVPDLHIGSCSEVLSNSLGKNDDKVLYLRMTFGIERHSLQGHISFFLNVASTNQLKACLQNYFDKILSS